MESLEKLELDNIGLQHYKSIFGLSSPGCSPVTLNVNDQQNNVYVVSGAIVTFKVCGSPNADFIIQDVGDIGIDGVRHTNNFYPYNVIDRGKLDSDGIHISSIPLNQVGTYIFRVGIWCTIADIDYCTDVSNAVVVTILEKGCVPNWQCRQPLDGSEYDANNCGGADRMSTRCNPDCGGTGCKDKGGKGLLLKVGLIVVVAGTVAYYTSRNGFKVRLRKDKKDKKDK